MVRRTAIRTAVIFYCVFAALFLIAGALHANHAVPSDFVWDGDPVIRIGGDEPSSEQVRPLFLEETLSPQTLQSSGVGTLVDGDTRTVWTVIPEATKMVHDASVTWMFHAPRHLTDLYVYVSPDEPVSGIGSAAGHVFIEYFSGGSWITWPQTTPLLLSNVEPGWRRIDLNSVNGAPLMTDRVRLRFAPEYGHSHVGGIGQVAWWGTPSPDVPNTRVFFANDDELDLPRGQVLQQVSTTIGIQDWPFVATGATVYFEAFDLEKDEASVYVNGVGPLPVAFDHPSHKPDGWEAHVFRIDPQWLDEGENTIVFRRDSGPNNGFKVRNIRVTLTWPTGRVEPVMLSASQNTSPAHRPEHAVDGSLSTWWETDWASPTQESAYWQADLGAEVALHGLRVAAAHAYADDVSVEVRRNGVWETISGYDHARYDQIPGLWREYDLRGITADALRLAFRNPDGDPVMGRIYEVEVLGNRVTPVDEGPTIVVNHPRAHSTIHQHVVVSGYSRAPLEGIRVNGLVPNGTGGAFALQIKLSETTNDPEPTAWVKVDAIDTAGRESSLSVPVFLRDGPEMHLNEPLDGLATTAASVRVAGTTEAGSYTIRVNGSTVPLRGRSFATDVALAEGGNAIVVEAVSPQGRRVEERRHIVRDTTPPSLTWILPADGAYIPEQPVELKGVVVDYHEVDVAINGQPAAVTDGYFLFDGLDLVEGPNLIEIEMTDELGNVSIERITYHLDTIRPVVTIADPPPRHLYTSQPVTVSGTVTDASPVEITVNGVRASVSGEIWSAVGVSLAEGDNLVVVVATDAAGNINTYALPVVLDTTPPLPFDLKADPPNSQEVWSSEPRPVLSFDAADATSGMSHYEISINGGPLTAVTSPYQLPGLADGIHEVTVRAYDVAGWHTDGQVTIYIDTTPPLPFTPVASPSSWTPDTQPVVSWTAVDEMSGIRGYELRVGNGAFVPVASPYPLPPLEDGIHEIMVRAFDRAGLYTDGLTQVFVDTTPPAVPTKLLGVPGPFSTEVRWQANDEWDLTHYVLRREPAFSDGIGERVIASETGPSYVDEDVAAGAFYTYQVRAVDHVENESAWSEPIIVRASVASVPVDPDEPTDVHFENVVIHVPEGAMAEAAYATVVALEHEETPELLDFPNRVGRVLHLGISESPDALTGGNSEFAVPVTVTFAFDEADIPEGFSAAHLHVVTYDESLGRWVRVPNQELSLATQTITAQLDHFSYFGIEASDHVPMDPAAYKELGVAPYQEYFGSFEANVSPASGRFFVRQTDLALPGRNGLDLRIARVYDGEKWVFDFPEVGSSAAGGWIRLENGATYEQKWQSGGRSSGTKRYEHHEGDHFVVEQDLTVRHRLTSKGMSLEEVRAPSAFRIIRTDGAVYHFGDTGRLTRIVDATGQNEIRFQYANDQVTITDTIGRVVTMQLDAKGNVTQVQAGDVEVLYEYSGGDLIRVTDPAGRVTEYGYGSYTLWFGEFGVYSKKIRPLTKVDFPSGGLLQVDYEVRQVSFETYTARLVAVHKEQRPAPGAGPEMAASFAYTYANPRSVEIVGTIVNEPDLRYEYEVNSNGQIARKTATISPSGASQRVEYSYDNKTRELLREVHSRLQGPPGASRIWTETFRRTFTYDNWGNLTHAADGSTGLNSYFRYANTNSQSGTLPAGFAPRPGGAVFGSISINTNIKNRVLSEGHINAHPQGGATRYMQTEYAYDTRGNRVAEASWDDGDWPQTTYAYDAYGNVTLMTDALGQETAYEYNQAYGHAYVTKVSVRNVTDASGNSRTVTAETGYNPARGWPVWERDGRGYVTWHERDALGRLTRTVVPSSEGVVPGADPVPTHGTTAIPSNVNDRPSRRQQFDDAANTMTLTDELGTRTVFTYDGLARLMKVDQLHPNGSVFGTTSFTYQARGEVASMIDAEGNETRFEYDGLGRLIKTLFPDDTATWADNPYEERVYDDDYNRVTVVDPDGHTATETRDWADRLIKTEQPVIVGGQLVTYVTEAAYDSIGNVVWTRDAEGHITQHVYDAIGRRIETREPGREVLQPRASSTTTIAPRTLFVYDAVGNVVAVRRPNGLATGDVERYTTTFVYDALNRVIRSDEPISLDVNAFDSTGGSGHRVTTLFYDDASNVTKEVTGFRAAGGQHVSDAVTRELTYNARNWLVQETDGTGAVTTHTYDAAGNSMTTTDPRGNVTSNPTDFTTWFAYDPFGRLVRAILPDDTPPGASEAANFTNWAYNYNPSAPGANPTVRFEYDRVGRNTAGVDPNGNRTQYVYNARGLRTQVIDATNAVSEFRYDNRGNPVWEQDPNGHVTQFTYDARGRVTEERFADGAVREYRYDGLDRLVWARDANGHVSRTEYTPSGDVRRTIDALQNMWTYVYDVEGHLRRVTDPDGHPMHQTVNELGWVLQETDREGRITRYGYDHLGRVVQKVDPLGIVTTYAYDNEGRLLEREAALGAERLTTSYDYDLVGNRTGMTDTSGETVWTYDPLNQVREQTALIQGQPYTTGFDYDQAGNRTGIFYPEATDWLRYTYTARHEVQSIPGIIDAIVYDAAGNRTSMTRANGVVGTYTADNRHRPDLWREVGSSGGGDILRFAYGYDGEGNVTSRNSNDYQYDALHRLTLANVAGVFEQEIAARAGAIAQDYFASKPVDFTRSPSQSFSLDTNAASVALDFGTSIAAVTRFTLAPRQGPTALQGRLVPESLVVATSGDNASYAVIDPDAVSVRQDEWGLWHFELDEPLGANYVKVHSRFDDRDETGEPVDVSTFENALGEMLTAWQPTNRARLEYAYDSRGNRIQETVTKASDESWTYLYDKTDRLITDGRYAYAFDLNGNMTAKSNRYALTQSGGRYEVAFHDISAYDPHAEAWEYTWDLYNRLTEVRKNGEVVGRYTYNGDNLRVAVEEDGLTRHVVFDPDGIRVIGEYAVGRGGASGNGLSDVETPDVRQIVYLNAFHLAAEVHGAWGDSAAAVYHLHVDMLGSAHAMTDPTGALVWTQDYLPFGEPLNERVMGAQPRYTFTGKPWDGAAGQYYFNARYYQATLGRFTAQDPARDGLNWYGYGRSNPLKYIDPNGERVWMVHGTRGSNETSWTESFETELGNAIGDRDTVRFGWTGGISDGARKRAAEELAKEILEYHLNNPGEPISIVGHSHGGNVGIVTTNILAEKGVEVDLLVTIATPVRGDYEPTSAGMKRHVNVYIEGGDPVQKLGGRGSFLGNMIGLDKPGGTFETSDDVVMKLARKAKVKDHFSIKDDEDYYRQWLPLLNQEWESPIQVEVPVANGRVQVQP